MRRLSAFDYAEVGLLLLLASLQLVAQDHAHHKAHRADDQAAQEGRPEPIHSEAHVEHQSDLTGEPEQESVDNQREQSERDDDGQASDEFCQWAHNGVDQRQDQPKAD